MSLFRRHKPRCLNELHTEGRDGKWNTIGAFCKKPKGHRSRWHATGNRSVKWKDRP